MKGVTWYPGSGWGVVGPQAFAWLSPDWEAAEVASLHALLAANSNPNQVVTLLESTGLAGRGFALVSNGSRRVLLTVGVPARATGGGNVRELKGVRGRAEACDLPDGWSATVGRCESGPGLPITDGVTQCAGLDWGTDVAVARVGSGPVSQADCVPEPPPTPDHHQPRPAPEPPNVSSSNPFADLWGQTMRRPVEAAAVRHVRDHDRPDDDGAAELPSSPRTERGSAVGSAPTAPLPQSPAAQDASRVDPVMPAGAPARPIGDATLITAIVDEASDLAGFGRVVSVDGGQVEIRGTVVIGRAPSGLPDEDCQLLRVPSPDRSVSRNHVVLRVVDDLVFGCDLGSHNGTALIRQGQSTVPLPKDPPRRLRHGDVLDLGLGCTVRLVGLP